MQKTERRFTKLFQRALEAQNNGSDAKAQHLYKQALRIQESPAIYANMGLAAYKRGYPRRAEQLYRRAIKLDPRCDVALSNLGAVLAERGEKAEAAELYAKSASIKPTATVLANLADLYAQEEHYDEAMGFLLKALELDPLHPQALCNAAMVAWSQNEWGVAVSAARRAIEVGAPPMARVNLGLLLMTVGEYQEGFKEYAWRFMAGNIMMRGPETMPIWKGRQHVPGSLYVWPEQGLGDEILYFGAVNATAQRADHVIWECEPRLVSLFQRSAPDNVTVVPFTGKPPKATAQIPAGCLMQMFQPNVPRETYLRADPERVAAYRAMMPEGKRVVGISWMSKNPQFGAKKSLEIADFQSFIEDDMSHCVSLQYGDGVDHGPLHLIPDLDLTRDIDGVAALISACDVVVTASNTVAHLAGALGVPCIVMVSQAGGKLWYWGTENETIWYRSVVVQRFERVS